MNVLTIVGARPQFIKAAVISRCINSCPGLTLKQSILHTGQHYDASMSEVFFQEMDIPKPHYNLEIGGGLHGAMTGRMLVGIEEVLIKERPDAVLVYGDTNSTLAGALAAAKLHVPVAHIEAGLRSFNMKMPEEINRILTDRISSLLFCPSQSAAEQLQKEGHGPENIHVVGDVMLDATLFYKRLALNREPQTDLATEVDGNFVLATIHRAENTDSPERLSAIFSALNSLGEKEPVVLPLHPRTRKMLNDSDIPLDHIKIINPVGYFDMLRLLNNCRLVMTDSGGLQKEAYFFQRPCITLRDETEWLELVTAGVNFIAGANKRLILDLAEKCDSIDFGKIDHSIYGDGSAGEKICQLLVRQLVR